MSQCHTTSSPSGPPGAPRVMRMAMRAHLIADLGAKGRVFIKSDTFKLGHESDYRRELAAFQLLQGLAVPRLVRLTAAERRALLGVHDRCVLCMQYAGERLGYYPLEPARLMGLFWFVTEHLVAFRRRGLVYSDIKLENVLVDQDLRAAYLIDLEGCTTISRSGRYTGLQLKATEPFVAPEHRRLIGSPERRLTEAALSYQLGAMYAFVWNGLHGMHREARPSLALHALREHHAARAQVSFAALIEACMAELPQARPRNVEQVWKRIRACARKPAYAREREIFETLRRPYRRALGALGLDGP